MPPSCKTAVGALGLALSFLAGAAEARPEGPPGDLLCANLAIQPVAVQVALRKMTVSGRIGNLITYRFTADVLEHFRGHVKVGQRITVHHGMEQGTTQPAVGDRLVMFLEPEKTGGFRVPDPSFAFPATEETLRRLRRCR